MFNPAQCQPEIEAYLAFSLGCQVRLVRFDRLAASSRLAPWKLETLADGQARSFVLQVDERDLEYEFQVLNALEPLNLPVPRAYGLDLEGVKLGLPCFLSDFIAGESLLGPLLTGEPWAEGIYLEAISTLQAVTREDLGAAARLITQESPQEVLQAAWGYFEQNPSPLAERVYRQLLESQPEFPSLRFSNGDLWLDNFLVLDQHLAGIIDFQGAAFSDPIYEFLLSFFVEPRLKERGIESRYCQRLGVDPGCLRWYHGLELFDTWRWTLATGQAFVHHTAQSLGANLEEWLGNC